MSLRAVYLTIELHARERASALASAALAAFLASAAKWDKPTRAALKEFIDSLTQFAEPTLVPPPRRTTRAQLIQLFTALGVPEAKS